MRVSASPVLLFVASFIVAPGLPPPSRQVSPIPLIGGKLQVLSVAGWWADNSQENLVLSEAKKVDADGLVNFLTINEVRYVTEYNQVTAVGLFNSEVKVHLLLMVNRGTKEFTQIKEQLAALAPEFTGKLLFVLINGALKSNLRSLGYFGLASGDLPRVGIYDGGSDMKWLLPQGPVSSERVRSFCHAFLKGELKAEKQAGAQAKSEL
ncbi:unnamed protein product [Boreogadus saida]